MSSMARLVMVVDSDHSSQSTEGVFLMLLLTFQEYVDYYGSAGVQHIALNTSDIITAVSGSYGVG